MTDNIMPCAVHIYSHAKHQINSVQIMQWAPSQSGHTESQPATQYHFSSDGLPKPF